MKKGLLFAALALVALLFTGCLKSTKATVTVTVEDVNEKVVGSDVMVYMFKKSAWNGGDCKPSDASKEIPTEDDGVAIFELSLANLEFIDNQTTLYFAVFNKKDNVIGSKSKVIKSGDNVRITIKLNEEL